MYASLISAGVSQLSDLYSSVTGQSNTSSTSTTSFDPSSSTSSISPTSAVNSTSSSGSKFSDALQKLFTDLQASASGSTSSSTTGSTDPTSTIAGDLQSVFGAAKDAHAHGYGHHHGALPAQLPGDDTQTVDGTTSTSGSGSSGSGTSSSNSFQNLASSLLAYAKNQSLTSSATATSLTA